ncbi:MAG: hypothetical protein CME61_05255 [Halobacteriovoraceae bacterium]|nr:hypothetical protein [Halobacteriovoraceae bacterium]
MSVNNDQVLDLNNCTYLKEGFFLYWNSPRSKWEEIIRSVPTQKYLIIPILWSFHHSKEVISFGDGRDEKSINFLIELGHNLGKKVILSLSITPTPLSANGGVPSGVSSHFSVSENGTSNFSIFQGSILSKSFSFYDRDVFKEFSKFIKALKSYLITVKVPYAVVSTEYVETKADGQNISRVKDFSPVQKQREKDFKSVSKNNNSASHLESLILDLYEELISESFKTDYNGRLRVNILGSSLKDSLNAIFDSHDEVNLNKVLTKNFKNNIFTIVPEDQFSKDPMLKRQVDELMTQNFLDECLGVDQISEEEDHLLPLSHLRFCHGKSVDIVESSEIIRHHLGIIDGRLSLSSSSKIFHLNKFLIDEGINSDLVYLLGSSFTEPDISLIKKLFFSSKKIIFDKSNASESLVSSLELYFSGKEIKKSTINLETEITIFEYNQNVMLVFDSGDLFKAPEDAQYQFWKKIIYAAGVEYLDIDGCNDLCYLWRKRSIRSTELSFEEIRRINIYNPHREKRKVNINISKKFFLLKKVDCTDSDVIRNQDKTVSIHLGPKGSLGIDFGVIE